MLRRVTRHTFLDGRRLPQTETTEYMQADRKREEHRGATGYCLRANGRTIYRPNPRTALIKRGDLQTTFLINFEDREFTAWPIPTFPTREELRGRVPVGPPPAQPAPTVRVETETVDTGDRKEFFGRTARHVITTRRVMWLESNRGNRQTVIDGWYIDLDTAVFCEPWWWAERSGHAFAFGTVHREGDPPAPPVTPTFRDIGEPERGYVVLSRSTDAGTITELEVTALSTAPLDAALFDVPADFVCVEQIRQDPVPPLVIRLKQTYERVRRRVAPRVR